MELRARQALTRNQSRRFQALPAATLACLFASACVRNELDHFYESSLSLGRILDAEYYEDVAREQRDRRLSAQPDAPPPPYPELPRPRTMTELRMQFMERQLVKLLKTRCVGGNAECMTSELRRLDFECTGVMSIECSLLNTARGEYDNPIKGTRERHLWTVTITADQEQPTIAARAELVESR